MDPNPITCITGSLVCVFRSLLRNLNKPDFKAHQKLNTFREKEPQREQALGEAKLRELYAGKRPGHKATNPKIHA